MNNLMPWRENILDPKLSEDERQLGEKLLLRSIQHSEYASEYRHLTCKRKARSSLVYQLGLFLDETKLIRCKGRMEFLDLDYQTKYPILLPKKHKITDLIIMSSLVTSFHYSLGYSASLIRQCFWIPKIRQRVKTVLK